MTRQHGRPLPPAVACQASASRSRSPCPRRTCTSSIANTARSGPDAIARWQRVRGRLTFVELTFSPRAAIATGGSPSTARSRPWRWMSRPTRGCRRTTSSSSTRTTSPSTSSSTTSSSDCASSTPKSRRSCSPARSTRCSAPAPTSRCSPAPRTCTRSTSASSPTRPATRSRRSGALSGQTWIAAVNGTAAGGGYELALACDEIVLVDDRASTVSLPEVPLLGVLPGTGGLTRLVDKRHVRRDLADAFATKAEGIKGQQAVDWGLVDAIAPRSAFDATVRDRALARAADVRPPGGRARHRADRRSTASGPTAARATTTSASTRSRARGGDDHGARAGVRRARPMPPSWSRQVPTAWVIAAARQLDDAILHLRFDEPEIGHVGAADGGRCRSRGRRARPCSSSRTG